MLASYEPDYYASVDRDRSATQQSVLYCVSDYMLLLNNTLMMNESCALLNVSENATAGPLRPPTRLRVSVPEALITGLLMSVVIIGTFLGNLLVISAVLTYRPLKTVQNYLIVSLSFSDCAVALVVMPLSMVDILFEPWLLGTATCDIWTTMDIFCCTASILNLCAIAIDRYFAIHDPISYACKRTAARMAAYIALVYVFSACVSVPPLLGWKPVRTDWQCMLSDEKPYVIVSACVSFFFPCLAMCFIYVKIYLAARRRLRKRAALRESPTVTTASNAAAVSLRRPRPQAARGPHAEAFRLARVSCNGAALHSPAPEVDEHSAMLDSNDESDPVEPDGRLNDARNAAQHVTVNRHAVRSDCYCAPSAYENHVRTFESDRQKISLTKERRAARTLGILMASFLLCWVPFSSTTS